MNPVRHRGLTAFDLTPNFLATFWSKVRKTKGCWIWKKYRDRDGYGRLAIAGFNGVGAHQVAFRIYKGRWSKRWVLHTCDNPPCVREDHLFEGDLRSNVDDMISKDRHTAGERNGRAKLTRRDVRDIRKTYRRGKIGYTRLASRFGVTRAMIRNVVKYRNWSNERTA